MPRRTWGFTPEEWDAMARELEDLLASAAAVRSTITYGEVARRVFDGRVSARSGALMDLLGEVDAEADAARGIMIASLVVRADSGMPGEGYYVFAAEQLGRPIEDRRAFWQREVERVWAAYAPEGTQAATVSRADAIAVLRGASAGFACGMAWLPDELVARFATQSSSSDTGERARGGGPIGWSRSRIRGREPAGCRRLRDRPACCRHRRGLVRRRGLFARSSAGRLD